jgi:radical SAM superfamily enzyme YgiQ (UPF0313 family)
LACFSVISDTQLAVTLSLAAIIRRQRPDTRIIAGGSAFAYRRSLFANQKWLAHTFDFICLGEAEPIIEALTSGNIATTAQPQNLETHPANLQQNNAELCNFAKPTIPDFSGMPLSDYLTPSLIMPLETARSCPWGRCAFCIHPVRAANGRPSYRPKPAKMVEQEIKQLFASGCRHFFIIDEAIPPSRLQMLAISLTFRHRRQRTSFRFSTANQRSCRSHSGFRFWTSPCLPCSGLFTSAVISQSLIF